MNGGSSDNGGILFPGRRKFGRFAPMPLVGIALLLVIMIILTPVLLANGKPAPGLLTQAELVVDRTSTNATFHFYVWALGETIRYDQIRVGLATAFNWTGSSAIAWNQLNWTRWYNSSDVLSVIVNSTDDPVALNISAHYTSPSGSTWYAGVVAFYTTVTSPPSGESLYSASGTSGVAVPSPFPVNNDTLPVPILLANVGPGTPP
jgi:hypothetical protein